MLQWFSEKKQMGVAWLLLFLMFFSVCRVVPARAAGRQLGLYRDDHDQTYNTFSIYGRHIFDDGEVWTYRTKAFNVSSASCSDVTNPPAGVKTTRLAITQNLSKYELYQGIEYTNSTYVMAGNAFANAFQTLYGDSIEAKVAEAVSQGEKTFEASMWFNNIFQVVHRTDPGLVKKVDGASMTPQYSFMSSEEYHTASAMANNPYVNSWTAGDFAGFYNYEYKFIVNILEATVNYVDKATGKVIVSQAAKKYGLQNASMSYVLPETTITVDGITYTFDNSYEIDYNGSITPVKAPSYDGKTLSWTFLNDGMEINAYFKEDDSKKKVPVKINMEASRDGTTYSTVKSFNSESDVYSGDTFAYAPDPTYQDDEGNNYSYTKKWRYTYTAKDGSNKTVNGTGDMPEFTVPQVKDGTTLNVYVRYQREEGASPTPSASPSVTLTPTPGVTPGATPTPTPAKQLSSNQEPPPNEGAVSRDVAVPTSVAAIESEVKYNHRYEVKTGGIATQEDLYSEGTASEFTLGYNLYHVTGTKTYPITVKKTYILTWEGPDPEETEEEEKETEILSEEVTLTTTINVTRGYGYWEIGNFSYYIADSMTLHNYALPNGTVTMPVIQSKISPPTAYSSDYPDNTDDPDTYKYGITLATETIDSGSKEKPSVPEDSFATLAYNAAHDQTGNIKVRNDYLYYWNGTVLDGSWAEYSTQSINRYPLNRYMGETLNAIFYKGEMVIDATKDNGAYPSSGTITYKAAPASVAAAPSNTYSLTAGPNSVILHAPVYCEGVITADNDRYAQLLQPAGNVIRLVLDEDSTLNDFNVRVNNTGAHIEFTGYFTRDYSNILRLPESNLSNIAKDTYGILRNEVKFPFDVYMDVGNDMNDSNDVFYPAGTWFTLGRSTQRFYLPLTVKEGIYMAEFRTIAVNANGRITKTQENANRDRDTYVATDTVPIEVSGRVYGLNVYDITDYPIWEEVFRIPGQLHLKINHQDRYPLGVDNTKYSSAKSYNYTVGIKDQYGNVTSRNVKYTLPLVGGSHPSYGNIGILKRGYTVRFSLDTIGTYYGDSARVVATPAYYWVDENGDNRTKVDMYYSAEVAGQSRALIKNGSSIDLANVAKYTAGDRNLGIPEEELSITAAIKNILLWKWQWQSDILIFGTVRTQMSSVFRTYTGRNYAQRVLAGANKTRVTNAGILEADLTMTKQSWYGETFIPGTAMFVDEGYDVLSYAKRYGVDYTEEFWKKDGYLIMNLDIRVYDANGSERLSYINKDNETDYCNMWRTEGALISKSDGKKVIFNFMDGDFAVYSVGQSAMDDYAVGGIY